jgi:signal transduction histidine kinase
MNAIQTVDDLVIRESMHVRAVQGLRTFPIVLITLVALDFALRGRVAPFPFHIWELAMTAATLARAILCQRLSSSLKTDEVAELKRYEPYLFASAILNALVIGSAFWLVASTGDLTVRLVMTLISCFYAIGALVNASSHFPSFAVVTILHLGQGVAFWLGLGSDSTPQLAIAFPYLAVGLLMIGFGREYSKQFRESLRIRTENAELLQRLEADKRIVERALEEVRIASESKSRFLAAASHDLRQPLHALTMFLGTLTFHVTTDDARRLLGRIKETTHVLEEQFNSLLDLSKFDAGAVRPAIGFFDLRSLIDRLIEEFHAEASAKNLAIAVVGDEAAARSDAMLIERLLRNLIGNAIKYTQSGSVVVRVDAGSENVVVEVVDTGCGIPEEQQKKVYEEYVQLGNPARQRRYGVGLGLAIAKRIDSLLDLRLTLQSAVGIGSRFSFQVPRVKEAALIPQRKSEARDPATFRTDETIWILDDDATVIESLREQLAAWGARVESFMEPIAMLDKLRDGSPPPRWIFTDDMLGASLSGLETAQILSSEFGLGKVCIVTGNTEPQRLTQLRGSGFPVIIKPARPESLIEIIER